ncbi:hypothetical protein Bsph_2996 [Lysinibacillus sphaericus C3-41]|uniref:Uncharacterized protein n=1 Tax=Lysinibacillus sphaericus (strain C3-41) TaxID=444177 RepID=B1HP79_LYSSC|nr:hypothetical protein Bsph_2996 [Lysinibacillus sphaericus C3-41]
MNVLGILMGILDDAFNVASILQRLLQEVIHIKLENDGTV